MDVWVFYPTLQCEQAHVYVIHMQYCVCQVHFKYCFKGIDCWLDDTFARAGLQTYLFICCFIHFWLSTIHSVDMSWYILLWQNMHLDRNRKKNPHFMLGFFGIYLCFSQFSTKVLSDLVQFLTVSAACGGLCLHDRATSFMYSSGVFKKMILGLFWMILIYLFFWISCFFSALYCCLLWFFSDNCFCVTASEMTTKTACK